LKPKKPKKRPTKPPLNLKPKKPKKQLQR
jgi:hypothetical protein